MMTKKQALSNHIIDVIIPVYRGLEETLACVHSVLNSIEDNETTLNLIVIDDYSPEPALSETLKVLAQEYAFTLLHNEKNLGFVGTVNRGMALSNNDVVLLNSDTEVANDWLDRLAKHTEVAQHGQVATVTPYSNNATLCSYPQIFAENDIPSGETVTSMDLYCRAANLGESLVIPTGVGFCMYIARRALNTVGVFDEKVFGKGYGEENDFCIKAEQSGFVNLHALDVFVWHKGSVSFSETAVALQENAIKVIRERYPNYEKNIQAFSAQDSGAIYRLRIALMHTKMPPTIMLAPSKLPADKSFVSYHQATVCFSEQDNTNNINIKSSSDININPFTISKTTFDKHKHWFFHLTYTNVVANQSLPPYLEQFSHQLPQQESIVLHIVNNHSGGTQRYVEALSCSDSNRYRHFVFYVTEKQQVLWDVWHDDYVLLALFDEQSGWQIAPLLNHLFSRPQRQVAIHLHSMFAAGLAVAEALPNKFPVTVTLHDHYFLSDNAFAANHITPNPVHIKRIQYVLKQATNVIVPSKYIFEQAQPYVEQNKLQWISHGVAQPLTQLAEHTTELTHQLMREATWDNSQRTVGFIGALGPHKGLAYLKKLSDLLIQNDIQVVILGYTADTFTPLAKEKYVLHGPYHHAQVPALIHEYNIDIMVFPPAIPESFCYTLSDIHGHVQVLAPDIGAFKYRIIAEHLGNTYPENISPEQLMMIIKNRFESPPASMEKANIMNEATMIEQTEACYVFMHSDEWAEKAFSQEAINAFCRENLNEDILKKSLVHLAKENYTQKQALIAKEQEVLAKEQEIFAKEKEILSKDRELKSQLGYQLNEKYTYYRWRFRHYASILVKQKILGYLKQLINVIVQK